MRSAWAWGMLVLLSGCLERTAEGGHLYDVTLGSGLEALMRVPEGEGTTLADRMMAGVCVIDLDGEAPLDLFFAGRASGTAGFVARGSLRYERAEIAIPLEGLDPFGCLAIDLSGDGRDDLVVSGAGGATWLERTETGFVRRELFAARPSHVFTGIAAGDLDGDRDLDLVIAGFVDVATAPTEGCGEAPCELRLNELAPIASRLLVNDEGIFVDHTITLAPALAVAEPTLVPVIVDLDGDGVPEILVGNDLGSRFADRVLVRRDGVYADEAVSWGLATNGSGFGMDTMGYAIGDVDGSGTLDLAATDFDGQPSALWICGPDRYCIERGRALGLLRSGETFRWGNALGDLDRDGDLDLIEATGHLYTPAEGASIGFPLTQAQAPNVWENLGGGLLARAIGGPDTALARTYEARGIALLDADDDGALDVVLATRVGSPALLENRYPETGHFLRVVLAGAPPNTGAVGARIEVVQDGTLYVRTRLAGEGYLGSFDPRVHVGLPDDTAVTVRVRWPDGAVTERSDVAIDGEIVIGPP